MVAEIPQMDPRPMRTMADMGMGGMAGMNMAGIDGMKAKDMPAMSKNDTTQDGMKGMAGMDMGIVVSPSARNASILPWPQTRSNRVPSVCGSLRRTTVIGFLRPTFSDIRDDHLPSSATAGLGFARWICAIGIKTRPFSGRSLKRSIKISRRGSR
jgi:hypothetical protein